MEIVQPRPFDLDEPRAKSALTRHELCETVWMAAAGKTYETMTPADYELLRIACPVYAGREHRERRR